MISLHYNLATGERRIWRLVVASIVILHEAGGGGGGSGGCWVVVELVNWYAILLVRVITLPFA